MDSFAFALRFVLSAVFFVAGCAKLVDIAGSRRAIVDWGLPATMARPLGLALPVAEIAVSILLLPASTRHVGGCWCDDLATRLHGGYRHQPYPGANPRMSLFWSIVFCACRLGDVCPQCRTLRYRCVSDVARHHCHAC